MTKLSDEIHSSASSRQAFLRAGGLVAFPTETVYGLGADATNAAAVRADFCGQGAAGDESADCACRRRAGGRRYAAEWPDGGAEACADVLAGAADDGGAEEAVRSSRGDGGVEDGRAAVPDHPLALELLHGSTGRWRRPVRIGRIT